MSAPLKPFREETDAADATERLSQEIARQEDALAGMKRAYSNAVLQYGKGSSEAKELEGRISGFRGTPGNRERMKDAGMWRRILAIRWRMPPKGRIN